VIPKIDIWRVASLMLSRHGDEAVAEGTKRADQLAADADLAGAAAWLRVIDAIRQLAITTPIGSVHWRDGGSRGRTGGSPDAVRSVSVPLKRPIVSKVALFDRWPLILIDLQTEE
jgi:hypothetical protein